MCRRRTGRRGRVASGVGVCRHVTVSPVESVCVVARHVVESPRHRVSVTRAAAGRGTGHGALCRGDPNSRRPGGMKQHDGRITRRLTAREKTTQIKRIDGVTIITCPYANILRGIIPHPDVPSRPCQFDARETCRF